MQTQNPQSLILLMTQGQLADFEAECLGELTHKQAKGIIRYLNGFMTDAPSFAQQIIAQNEAKKMKVDKSDSEATEGKKPEPEKSTNKNQSQAQGDK